MLPLKDELWWAWFSFYQIPKEERTIEARFGEAFLEYKRRIQPDEAGGPFTVELAGGCYLVQWYSVNRRETKEGREIKVPDDGSITFTAPFAEAGPTVLYLKHVEH